MKIKRVGRYEIPLEPRAFDAVELAIKRAY